MKNAFKEKGSNIIDVFFLTDKETGDFYGSSFVEFESPEQASSAEYAGMPILGRPCGSTMDFAKPRTSGGAGSKKKFEEHHPSEISRMVQIQCFSETCLLISIFRYFTRKDARSNLLRFVG